VLEPLRALAPVHVVRGNVDYGTWADALPRFSMTPCWPQRAERRSASMRATESVPPPGVNGTTRRI